MRTDTRTVERLARKFAPDIREGRSSEAAGYCTGYWAEARQRQPEATVTLLRP